MNRLGKSRKDGEGQDDVRTNTMPGSREFRYERGQAVGSESETELPFRAISIGPPKKWSPKPTKPLNNCRTSRKASGSRASGPLGVPFPGSAIRYFTLVQVPQMEWVMARKIFEKRESGHEPRRVLRHYFNGGPPFSEASRTRGTGRESPSPGDCLGGRHPFGPD